MERKANSPIIPLILFSRRQLTLGNFIAIGAGVIEASLVFLPLLAVVALGIKESAASFMLMPLVVAMSIGSPLTGQLLDRFGSKLVLTAGTAISAAGTILISFFSTSMTMYILSTVLIGFGLSALLGAPLRYIMLSEANKSERSVAQGITNVFISVGQLIGSALVGALAASGATRLIGYGNGYRFIGLAGVILVVLTFFLKNRLIEQETIHRNQAAATAD
jgi:MFS family permease